MAIRKMGKNVKSTAGKKEVKCKLIQAEIAAYNQDNIAKIYTDLHAEKPDALLMLLARKEYRNKQLPVPREIEREIDRYTEQLSRTGTVNEIIDALEMNAEGKGRGYKRVFARIKKRVMMNSVERKENEMKSQIEAESSLSFKNPSFTMEPIKIKSLPVAESIFDAMDAIFSSIKTDGDIKAPVATGSTVPNPAIESSTFLSHTGRMFIKYRLVSNQKLIQNISIEDLITSLSVLKTRADVYACVAQRFNTTPNNLAVQFGKWKKEKQEKTTKNKTTTLKGWGY